MPSLQSLRTRRTDSPPKLLRGYSSSWGFIIADVAQKLWELEFTIHKVKVSTTPEEKSINFFFISDSRYVEPPTIFSPSFETRR